MLSQEFSQSHDGYIAEADGGIGKVTPDMQRRIRDIAFPPEKREKPAPCRRRNDNTKNAEGISTPYLH